MLLTLGIALLHKCLVNKSPGGYSIIFFEGWAGWGLKPLPISIKGFFSLKNWLIWHLFVCFFVVFFVVFFYFLFFFFWILSFSIFANRNPFLRVFPPQKRLISQFFFSVFVEWVPILRIFLTKMGPLSEDFCWKPNHLGSTSPYALTCEYPPQQKYHIYFCSWCRKPQGHTVSGWLWNTWIELEICKVQGSSSRTNLFKAHSLLTW